METTEINPRLIDGEPTCSGEECPCFVPMNEVNFEPERCHHPVYGWYRPVMINDVCLPGLRRLLSEAREERDAAVNGIKRAGKIIAQFCEKECPVNNVGILPLCATADEFGPHQPNPEDCNRGCPCIGRDIWFAFREHAPAPSGADGGEGKK